MLTFVEACLALPDGETLRDYYRTIELTCWSDTKNDDVLISKLYQTRDEDAPWVIEFEGHTYHQGQCSGPSMGWVCYEREQTTGWTAERAKFI